ncbi:hypothetical protein M192_gp006 [Halorubrum tailed phage 8]|uniref:Uncharacterized protein n=3 Tax=Haloferacalesvirus TaxID=2843389 RepID=R4T557_9CAUD|nr:hypothetical protein M192_gp006 [Halorubrum tailed phage 8]UBF19079.1 hypothetical protein HRTV-14_gp6 [Halorubrum phage HRTV-14]UBF19205.1 hypothetical protein HRTV-17_gp6 [Halorubrum phage HRTV-17]UBF19332.1 hypothetical protein HRTV-19_gp6 [Halorubrum virus HRTV-19]UBF19461.1 hypothetical protein HRTV-23_gp6 [Halorubrum virus HRTV-23]AGM10754.1 hypothetical protein HRTV8_6 [Halorubrum tailed phage 8]
MNPYEPVEVSKSKQYPRGDTPSDGEAVGLEFGDSGIEPPRYLIEDSRNWYAWIEALNGDSYVNLDYMR